jgi:hypothetical protein
VVAHVRKEPDGQFLIEVETAGLDRPAFRFGYVAENEVSIRALESVQQQGRFIIRRPPAAICQLVIYVTDPNHGDDEITYFGPYF